MNYCETAFNPRPLRSQEMKVVTLLGFSMTGVLRTLALYMSPLPSKSPPCFMPPARQELADCSGVGLHRGRGRFSSLLSSSLYGTHTCYLLLSSCPVPSQKKRKNNSMGAQLWRGGAGEQPYPTPCFNPIPWETDNLPQQQGCHLVC